MLASPKKADAEAIGENIFSANHDDSELDDNDVENDGFSESDSTSPLKIDSPEREANNVDSNYEERPEQVFTTTELAEAKPSVDVPESQVEPPTSELRTAESYNSHFVNDVSSHNGDTAVDYNINCGLNGDTPFEESLLSHKKRSKKSRTKFTLKVKTSVNGLSAKKKKSSKKDKSSRKKSSKKLNNYVQDGAIPESETRPEYAQYLGLKPSVKFRCNRCGAKKFATIGLLQEHMASCNGQMPLSVPSVSPVRTSSKSDTTVSSYNVNPAANLRITRKVFLCSSCGTYYQSYNLFIHMREMHNKFICLYCLTMFCDPQQLYDHLIETHKVKLGEYTTVSQIRNAFKDPFYITCCTCNRIFSDNECFDQHVCDETLVPESVPPKVCESPVINGDADTVPHLEDSELPISRNVTPYQSPIVPDDGSDAMSITENQEPVETGSSFKPESPPPEKISSPPRNEFLPDFPRSTTSAEYQHIPSPVNEPSTFPEYFPSEPVHEPSLPEVSSTGDTEPLQTNEHELPRPPVQEDETDSDSLNAVFNDSVPEEITQKISQPLPMALMLDESVASLSPQVIIRECIRTSCTSCVFCNNAIVISVHGGVLINHLLTEHRYLPTKNEDDSESVVEKLKAGLEELGEAHFNASSFEFDGTFSCFQCTFNTILLKELCAHKRKTHQMKLFLCIVCKCNFLHYSELLCHQCPGVYSSEVYSLRFRCCFCTIQDIPSAFRLMIHLRKIHKACDFCLLRFNDQCELFSHMTKQHKMHHLCYKCNLAYRSRNDINKHLFWKHGTESVLCKRCLQKKWPHAYHFCMPATKYTCEECNRVFSKAVALTVHRRAHTGDFPFNCECDQRFISKKLLTAHQRKAHPVEGETEPPEPSDTAKTDGHANDSASNNNEHHEDGEKKRRKKKKKRAKVDEKPLLDELPPLNLSSESDEESAAEEEPAKAEPEHVEKPVSPIPSSSFVDIVPETPSSPPPAELQENIVNVAEESKPEEPELENMVEKMLNCLLVEHSYCIPDAIFHSESVDNQAENQNEADNSLSPHAHGKGRDKACCKSVTPKKRKRVKKNSSAGESSSSSSSDSDTSSSSCGSNCSCNRSNSNCSSSSSGSDASTTPEKKKKLKIITKNPEEEKVNGIDEAAQEAQRKQLMLLNARESDLDTDISTADEDFYDEKPVFVPLVDKPQVEVPSSSVLVNELPDVAGTPNNAEKSRSRKDKKKKRKKIKLNLTGRITQNCGNLLQNTNTPRLINVAPVVPENEFPKEEQCSSMYMYQSHYGEQNSYHQSPMETAMTPNRAEVPANSTDSGRLSKRKRVKNKFYGYSSNEEANQEMVPKQPKKRLSASKRTQKARTFIGIRTKQLPPLGRKLKITLPHVPPAQSSPTQQMYRPPVPPPRAVTFANPYESFRDRLSSSDDSDSTERGHTLVINIPKEKMNNSSYRSPTYSDDSASSNSYASASTPPRVEVPIPPITFTRSPVKSNVNVYCYCRCPYDEVSEMIACDGPNCNIEWFHFECVGITVPPKGKWYCPNCRTNRENISRFI